MAATSAAQPARVLVPARATAGAATVPPIAAAAAAMRPMPANAADAAAVAAVPLIAATPSPAGPIAAVTRIAPNIPTSALPLPTRPTPLMPPPRPPDPSLPSPASPPTSALPLPTRPTPLMPLPTVPTSPESTAVFSPNDAAVLLMIGAAAALSLCMRCIHLLRRRTLGLAPPSRLVFSCPLPCCMYPHLSSMRWRGMRRGMHSVPSQISLAAATSSAEHVAAMMELNDAAGGAAASE